MNQLETVVVLYEESKSDELLFKKALKHLGFQVKLLVVTNQEELCRILEQLADVSCLIVSARSFARNPIDLVQDIRACRHHQHMKTIIFGGTGSPLDLKAAEEAHPDLILQKPFDLDQYIESIRSILNTCHVECKALDD